MSNREMTAEEAIKALDKVVKSRRDDPWVRCARCNATWYSGQKRCNKCGSDRWRA